MGRAVDLNCDVGEGFGPYAMGQDDQVIPLVTSVNVACGFHAGDPLIMARTVRLARESGAAVGAHPGLPDRAGFGRRVLAVTPAEVEADVLYQVGALLGFCQAAGVRLRHVKPHGALYHMAAADAVLARAVAAAVRALDRDLVLYAPPGSALAAEGERMGLQVAREAFADRAYDAQGRLLPRTHPGAVLSGDAAALQALRLALEGCVTSVSGETVAVAADTICLHGDAPGAADTARAVRCALLAHGVALAHPAAFLAPRGGEVEG